MWSAPEALGDQRSALSAGWRRRRYFVESGYLRPIRGSQVEEYNPFAAYYGTDRYQKSARSLYLELVDLDLDDTTAIEGFASHWGLLGLLQHRLHQVAHISTTRQAERPEYSVPDVDRIIEIPGAHLTEALVWEHPVTHFSAEWLFRTGAAGEREIPVPQAVEAELISQAIAAVDATGRLSLNSGCTPKQLQPMLDALHRREYEAWEAGCAFTTGSVLRRNLRGYVEEVSLEDHYSPFFPDVEEWRGSAKRRLEYIPGQTLTDEVGAAMSFLARCSFSFPPLQSPELWDFLSEPLEAFRAAVQDLRRLYELCVYAASHPVIKAPEGRHVGPEWERHAEDDVKRSNIRRLFTRELLNIHPVPVRNDEHGWTWRWSFPSLLSAAYAMMFLDHAVSRRRLCYCASETCGKSFVTERSDRRYCSESCQNTQKQREFRRAKKAAVQPKKGEGM